MRITFRQLNTNLQRNINNRYGDLAHLQEMLSTGKRLLRPSDDPVDVSNDLGLRSKVTQITQYKSNIRDGQGFMTVTDTAMSSMNTLFQRMRELAIQGSTDTIGVNERLYIQKETEQLLRQAITLTNTTYKGDYVFGGTQTKIVPFPTAASQGAVATDYTGLKMSYYNAAAIGVPAQLRDAFSGDPITKIIPGSFTLSIAGVNYVENRDYTVDYVNGTITPLIGALAVDVSDGGAFGGPNYQLNGVSLTFEHITRGKDIYGDYVVSSGDILREIEQGIAAPVNITASELTRDPATGIDMLETAIRLGQNLLQDNRAGVENGITQIDAVFKTLLAAQSKNGARINRFETTLDRNESQNTETTRLQSELEDADFAATAMNFSLIQTTYQAALKSAATVIQPTLTNFL